MEEGARLAAGALFALPADQLSPLAAVTSGVFDHV